ncbi:FAD/NAD(P)-binding domain-containing protein [Heliocybe sulcata]|uniref:FAD/NAD(P)-binding domain-containing protein n=1 Tax=Heliocybe sulcata TaxID=5364 RepID=A0A5C3MYB6_9AGAM|nr:FAD/NAD(P)-binding domain-containing protein [Heliocybe sulcata]
MTGKTASIPAVPSLTIEFVIVGGGIAGLACAFALRRIGHRVLVLERDDGTDQTKVAGGCRLPPNMSKILNHWGFERQLRENAVVSGATFLSIYESGSLLGTHVWDQEVLKEAGGDFVFCHHTDLRRMLRTAAEEAGASIRYGCRVASVDPVTRSVTLESGEVVSGDVIIGADGSLGVCREVLAAGRITEAPTVHAFFNTTVSGEEIRKDPDLTYFLEQEHHTLFAWFGDGHAVLGYPLGGNEDFALKIYAPEDGEGHGSWEDHVPVEQLRRVMATSEGRLQKLASLACAPARLRVTEPVALDDWVHNDGRLLLIGDAAHTLPPGCIQGSAMGVEDAAVLAKLFSHLRSEDQIRNFLYAFQDLRQKRCSDVLKQEMGNLLFMTMPPGSMQEARDQSMTQKHEAGLNVLGSDADGATEQWEEIKEIFGYEAEDEADNWWVKWGLLREHAKARAMEVKTSE